MGLTSPSPLYTEQVDSVFLVLETESTGPSMSARVSLSISELLEPFPTVSFLHCPDCLTFAVGEKKNHTPGKAGIREDV